MVRLRIPELSREKNILHPHKEMVKRGISSHIATEYLKGNKEMLVMAHIEILCLIFRCMPNDLFEIVPDKPSTADLTQPVYQLGPRKPFNLEEKLKGMTPDEIKKMLEEEEKKKNGQGKE